ncbi:DUF4232 domain-containing protein [Streptomyces sp. SID8379]|uniref:DUF4232 domain-containing protein n=1 Tax=unclassified Streptomyces TaxID=2593676 RepID=UPI0003A016A5|nr:DUF4232 domain-containing protein [Streptomyces sp. HmicA12]MYW69770.1 DUF4232 domain-containing protein [Streptomyces sp. SID8379]
MTACGANDDQASAHATTGSTQSASASASASRSAGEGSAASSSSASAPTGSSTAPATTEEKAAASDHGGMGSDCTTDALKVALKPSGQEMNSKYFDLTLTNATDGTCALKGYAGLSLTDTHGKRVGAPATRSNNGSVRDVVLKPGQAAHAVVQTPRKEVTDGNCWSKAARIKVYPPNNTAPLTAAAPGSLQVCGDTFTVGPFTAHAL